MVMVNVDKLERGATAEAARVTSRAFLRNPLHVAAFKGDSEALRRRQEAMYKTIFDHFPESFSRPGGARRLSASSE